jgi:hypothetical protein
MSIDLDEVFAGCTRPCLTRALPDGRTLQVSPLMFNRARLGLAEAGTTTTGLDGGFDDVW